MVPNYDHLAYDSVYEFWASELSNVYYSPLTYQGKNYPTVENAYKAFQYNRPNFANLRIDEIQKIEANLIPVESWEEQRVGIMRELLRVKFNQNEALKQTLIETNHLELVEMTNLDSADDPRVLEKPKQAEYWLDGGDYESTWSRAEDGTGKNVIGQALMELRLEYIIEKRFNEHFTYLIQEVKPWGVDLSQCDLRQFKDIYFRSISIQAKLRELDTNQPSFIQLELIETQMLEECEATLGINTISTENKRSRWEVISRGDLKRNDSPLLRLLGLNAFLEHSPDEIKRRIQLIFPTEQ